jgi:hypothetical protein
MIFLTNDHNIIRGYECTYIDRVDRIPKNQLKTIYIITKGSIINYGLIKKLKIFTSQTAVKIAIVK